MVSLMPLYNSAHQALCFFSNHVTNVHIQHNWPGNVRCVFAFPGVARQNVTPVLMQPDQKKQFEIEVDASNYAIGAVLMQKGEKDILHPVAFFSKTMNDAQRNYNVYNRELLALVETFRHWRHYLHSAAHKVKVHTDHANLLYWKNPGDHNR
jgi:hypothetical protein